MTTPDFAFSIWQMKILLFFLGLLVLCGVVLFLYSLMNAQDGYEDDDGFHIDEE